MKRGRSIERDFGLTARTRREADLFFADLMGAPRRRRAPIGQRAIDIGRESDESAAPAAEVAHAPCGCKGQTAILSEADAQIAKLSAAAPGGGKLDGDKLTWHSERLARDVRPSLVAATLAGVGILLWVVGAFVLARRGTFAVGPTGVIVLGLALWFVGLYKT